jgi:hypothetical protein
MIRCDEILCFESLNMITAWCWTKEQEISHQFWEYCKYNLLNFSPVLFFLNVFLTHGCLTTKKKELLSKTWKTVIRTDKRVLKAGILSSNLKIFKFFLLFLRPNCFPNKLGQSTSKKQLKIFKFEDKIPAFSARLSVLITFCKFLIAILFF